VEERSSGVAEAVGGFIPLLHYSTPPLLLFLRPPLPILLAVRKNLN
jgi:hypothetical protein